MNIINLIKAILLRTAPVTGASVTEDNIETILTGGDPLEIKTFEVEYLGQKVDVSIRWKDTPTSTNIIIVESFISSSAALLYIWLVRDYNRRFSAALAAQEVAATIRAGSTLPPQVGPQNPAIVQSNRALPEFMKEMEIYSDFLNEVHIGQGDIKQTLSASEFIIFEEASEAATEAIFFQMDWDDFQEAVRLDDWTKWNKSAETNVGRIVINNADDLAQQRISLIKRVDAIQDRFGEATLAMKNFPLAKKWASKWGRFSGNATKALGIVGAAEIGLFLGTLILKPFLDKEEEQGFLNFYLEPIFNKSVRKAFGLTYPKGQFSQYYGIELPTDMTTILAMIAYKEWVAEWLTGKIDLPVETFRDALLLVFLPLTPYMEIVIGDITAIIDYDLDWIQIRDQFLFNKLKVTEDNVFRAMELFLGAFALKTVYKVYAMPLFK